MIIKSSVLTTGKECKRPLKYQANREVFEQYAHYYSKDAQQLFDEIDAVLIGPEEELDMSSEEEEDNEIRKSDRIAVSLVVGEADVRADVYVLDSETEAFYVHHDIFLHGTPTDLAVLDREDDPLAFISNKDGTIAVYRLFVSNHFLPDAFIPAHDKKIHNIAIDSGVILSNDTEEMKLFDIATLKQVNKINKPTRAMAMNGNKIYYEEKNCVYMVDTRAGESDSIKIFKETGNVTSITAVGITVGAGTEDGLVFYSTDGCPQNNFKVHNERVNNLIASGNRYIVSASEDESIALFDMENKEIIERKDTGIDSVTVGIPLDSVAVYSYPLEDGELGIGSFEEGLLRAE